MRNLYNRLMMSPEDAGNSGGPKEPMSKGSILDVLNAVDDLEPDVKLNDELELDDETTDDIEGETQKEEKVKKETSEDDEDTEEVDELAELEEELKEPKEEDLELMTPVKKREILAKYPNVFKDFPSLEKAYYRELEYTKLLPTIADAKDAVQAVTVLENFEADLKEGKTVDLMRAVLKDDPNAFNKLADSYMDNLAQVSEGAYYHVLGNIAKDMVRAMSNMSKKTNNKELLDAATVFYQFMFNDTEWKPKTKLAIEDEPNSEKISFQKEREDFERTKYTDKASELMSGVQNRITSIVDSNIDKTNLMTPFVKKNAIKEVQTKLDSLVKADTRFQSIINKLWEKAREAKYSRESMQSIESAHIAKRKGLLPTVILSVKKEALKGSGVTRKKSNANTVETNETENENPRRQTQRVDSTKIDRTKPLPHESSLDFMMRSTK